MLSQNAIYLSLYINRRVFVIHYDNIKDFLISIINYRDFISIIKMNTLLIKKIRIINYNNI